MTMLTPIQAASRLHGFTYYRSTREPNGDDVREQATDLHDLVFKIVLPLLREVMQNHAEDNSDLLDILDDQTLTACARLEKRAHDLDEEEHTRASRPMRAESYR